jgi:hypothetical protein
MKKSLWVMVIWLNVAGGSAVASDSTVWNQGELVLMDGTKLTGGINFNWIADIVQYRQEDKIKAYSAFQVREFKYFDDHQNTLRKFVAIECPVKYGRPRPSFLEEVVPGSLTVYRGARSIRESIKVANLSNYSSDEELVKNIDSFTYFVFTGKELIDLNVFYRKVWPTLKVRYEQELKKYASRMQASLTSTLAQLHLINRYNSLVSQQPISIQELLSTGQ